MVQNVVIPSFLMTLAETKMLNVLSDIITLAWITSVPTVRPTEVIAAQRECVEILMDRTLLLPAQVDLVKLLEPLLVLYVMSKNVAVKIMSPLVGVKAWLAVMMNTQNTHLPCALVEKEAALLNCVVLTRPVKTKECAVTPRWDSQRKMISIKLDVLDVQITVKNAVILSHQLAPQPK
jgi:hypothetical protein